MSQRHQVHLGIAVEDKAHNSRLLKVHLKDITPFMEGELDDHDGIEKFTYTDDETDATVTEEIVTTSHVTCEWFGFDTNRVFPPDIRRGEQILVIKLGDEDLYYWLPLGRDDRLRRGELYRLAVSNKNKNSKEFEDEDTYFLELDTMFHKRIRLITSKSDDEDFRYEIVIDAKRNFISLSDDDENRIILESDIPRIKLENNKKSILDVNHEDIYALCKGKIVLKAEDQIIIDTKNLSVNAREAIRLDASNIGFGFKHMEIKGNTLSIDASTQLSPILKAPMIKAGVYQQAPMMVPYPPVEIDIKDRDRTTSEGTTNSPQQDTQGGDDNRHCVAWEDMNVVLAAVEECFEVVNNRISLPASHGNLVTEAESAKMSTMRGY